MHIWKRFLLIAIQSAFKLSWTFLRGGILVCPKGTNYFLLRQECAYYGLQPEKKTALHHFRTLGKKKALFVRLYGAMTV